MKRVEDRRARDLLQAQTPAQAQAQKHQPASMCGAASTGALAALSHAADRALQRADTLPAHAHSGAASSHCAGARELHHHHQQQQTHRAATSPATASLRGLGSNVALSLRCARALRAGR